MLTQSQIMRLTAVLLLSEFLFINDAVAGLPFVMPLKSRHPAKSQRLIKEVQEIDFQADKMAYHTRTDDVPSGNRFGLMNPDQELFPSHCNPDSGDKLSFRYFCCSGKPLKFKWLASLCDFVARRSKEEMGDIGRQHQLLDKMSARDSKAQLNSIVEKWVENMRSRRSVGSHNYGYL